ncbi:MAG TPA: glycosyltransferase family 4 protein [Patescibacteria group bacterium]|nr:glycosyltransferase family 4 protein [Patescibacteria group bacterium]
MDTLGGGERYSIAFAKVLSDTGWDVNVEWKNPGIKKELEKRFGMDLKEINIVPDVKRGDGYDLCFWISDGSIPTLKARKNILHFQVPFHHTGGNNLLNKMKLFRVDKIVCNSQFTKKFIDREYGVESIVIYPPVATDKIKSKRKENMILFVGRFSELKQLKHQDILIKSFKKMIDSGLKDWRLVLAGGVEVGVDSNLEKLENLAKGYPIEIIKSPDFATLKDLYGKAKIFWSASGYGENEEKNPENVEHFGITVVEAMAGGAVPLAFDAGGHKEIVENDENGMLWYSPSQLVNETKKLINYPKRLNELSRNAKKDCYKFSTQVFEERVRSLII